MKIRNSEKGEAVIAFAFVILLSGLFTSGAVTKEIGFKKINVEAVKKNAVAEYKVNP